MSKTRRAELLLNVLNNILDTADIESFYDHPKWLLEFLGRKEGFFHNIESDEFQASISNNDLFEFGYSFLLHEGMELNPSEKKSLEFIRDFVSYKIKRTYDPVTRVLNRESFFLFVNEILQGHNGSNDCSLILIDINNFKNINSTLGYNVGDKVLRLVGNSIKTALRTHAPNSVMGRYFGDEFVIYIHGTDQQLLNTIINSIRDNVTEYVFALWEEGKKPMVTLNYLSEVSPADSPKEAIARLRSKNEQNRKHYRFSSSNY